MSERNPLPLIITAICSTLGSVLVLWFYGYLHIAKPEDSLLLAEFTMYKTQPGEDYKVALKPATQVAQCIDGVLVLFAPVLLLVAVAVVTRHQSGAGSALRGWQFPEQGLRARASDQTLRQR
mgnify:CR=1 FL=1